MSMNMFNDVYLESAFLIYSPPQRDQYYRPFTMDVEDRSIHDLLMTVDQSRTLNRTAFVNNASKILSLAAEPHGVVQVPSGLSQARYNFTLTFVTKTPGADDVEVISGFTNYDGVSEMGHIDPNLVFYINNRQRVRRSSRISASGQNQLVTMPTNNIMLAPSITNPNEISMRPEDAVQYRGFDLFRASTDVFQDYSLLTNMGAAKLADVKHSNPLDYLLDTSTSYVTSMGENAGYDFSENNDTYYSTAKGNLAVGTMMVSDFYMKMQQHGYNADKSFTYQQINSVWPTHHSFWQVSMPRNEVIHRLNVNDTQHWAGADNITKIAASMTHILPGIMGNSLLKKVSLILHNPGWGGPTVEVLDYAEFSPDVTTPHSLICFRQAIANDIGNSLIQQYCQTYYVVMTVDLLCASTFEISLDGGPLVPYRAPMFCNSYNNPMRGIDNSSLTEIASSVENLAQDIHQVLSTKASPEIMVGGTLKPFTPSVRLSHPQPQQHNPNVGIPMQPNYTLPLPDGWR